MPATFVFHSFSSTLPGDQCPNLTREDEFSAAKTLRDLLERRLLGMAPGDEEDLLRKQEIAGGCGDSGDFWLVLYWFYMGFIFSMGFYRGRIASIQKKRNETGADCFRPKVAYLAACDSWRYATCTTWCINEPREMYQH